MNKSLELIFWPILYDIIVIVITIINTGSLSKTKHNLTYRMAKRLSSKLLCISSQILMNFTDFIFHNVVQRRS